MPPRGLGPAAALVAAPGLARPGASNPAADALAAGLEGAAGTFADAGDVPGFAPDDVPGAGGGTVAGFSEAGGITSAPGSTLGGVSDSFSELAGGVQTVSFPAPRDEVDAGPAGDALAPAQAQERGSSRAEPDPDELYEHVLDRLRHELLAERERLGSLIPELPE